jgi:large subunit GTPase 1
MSPAPRVAEQHSLLLTPFERNLQVWRQLWRVIERSHLIVQIVDGRNPVTFRCEDLEKYVSEVGIGMGNKQKRGVRKSLLLINKSDLLTKKQRYVPASRSISARSPC